MASVETVQGAVDADELGLVLVHEHVRFRDEAVAEQWPSRYDEQLEYDAALVAVKAAKERGVQTIVDPTAMFGGRDVRFMERVANETGVRIVACTGIYSYDYLPHYFENRDIDVMADHFVEDIEQQYVTERSTSKWLRIAVRCPRRSGRPSRRRRGWRSSGGDSRSCRCRCTPRSVRRSRWPRAP